MLRAACRLSELEDSSGFGFHVSSHLDFQPCKDPFNPLSHKCKRSSLFKIIDEMMILNTCSASSFVVALLIANAITASAFAPTIATRNLSTSSSASRICSADNAFAGGLQALPPQKPLNEYATPTNVLPFYGYDLVKTDSSAGYHAVVTGYVDGAPIDDLFKLTSDFTEESVFWENLFINFNQPSYRSGDPNGVGDVRDFVWEGGRQYVEQLSFADPKSHTFAYTLHASTAKSVQPTFNSLITCWSFQDEPDKNRVKVTCHVILQLSSLFSVFSPVIQKAQRKAYTRVIESMQDYYK